MSAAGKLAEQVILSESLIALLACSGLSWSETERVLTQIGEDCGMRLQHYCFIAVHSFLEHQQAC